MNVAFPIDNFSFPSCKEKKITFTIVETPKSVFDTYIVTCIHTYKIKH